MNDKELIFRLRSAHEVRRDSSDLKDLIELCHQAADLLEHVVAERDELKEDVATLMQEVAQMGDDIIELNELQDMDDDDKRP